MIKLKDLFIREYVNRLTLEDVSKFALKEGVTLTNSELDIIYTYIKKYYYTFIYGNPKVYLEELKNKVKPFTYEKIESLYYKFKIKISK